MRRLLGLICVAIPLAACQPGLAQINRKDSLQPSDSIASDISASGHEGHGDSVTTSARHLFEKRILPIFTAAKPSSCTECHLSGVELADYIKPSQSETFSSLVKAGLIDREAPDDSKLLKFISRRPDKPSLLTDEVRQQEYDAFHAWICAAVKDPTLKELAPNGHAGPQIPDEVIRHARTDRVLASFIDNIWTEVGRCAACHSPNQNQKQVEEHGDVVSWIIPDSPQATLDHMLAADIINPQLPLESLLLTKPTMQVEHGGGQKMVVGDRTYKQFRRFIDDYARVADGSYTTVESLPLEDDEVSLVTDIWLKLTDVPAKFDKMLLQVDLYRGDGNDWTAYRVASSDRPVFGGGNLWQHSLSLTAPRGSDWAAAMHSKTLPPGRYLVKISIDQEGKLQDDYTSELDSQDFVAEIELESRWPAGYGNMTVIAFPNE